MNLSNNLNQDSLNQNSLNQNSLNPIRHVAAWRGDELFQRPEWNLRFSADELSQLLTIAEKWSSDDPLESYAAIDELDRTFLLAPKLREIQRLLEEGAGVVRLLGFPADDVNVEIAKRAFWLICSNQIGTPVSQSAAGERIFSVRDAGFANTDARARGPNTRKKLSFHTDRCDVISFLCYRQAKSGGDNCVVSSIALYNQMLAERPDLVEVLMQPYLYQRHNVDKGNERPYCEQPVFSIHEGHFAANLLRVLIDRAYSMPDTPDMSPQQREALDYLEQVAERTELQANFRQEAGDILLLNNFVTLHRRTEFVDYDEPERKRHLLRIWLSVPNSRPLDPRFAGNYGNTSAGALRGGMKPQTQSE